MKQKYDSELTLEQLAAMPDEEIDYSDIPALDESFWKNARLVHPDRTQTVTLRVKRSVLDAYKATGEDYQTRMNAVLEGYARSVLKVTGDKEPN